MKNYARVLIKSLPNHFESALLQFLARDHQALASFGRLFRMIGSCPFPDGSDQSKGWIFQISSAY